MSGVSSQRVVVTAGGSGIGRATAECFLAAGARVYICDNQQGMLDAALRANPKLLGSLADVGKPGDVERMMKDALKKLGGIDVLVNNAGIGGPKAAVEDVSYEDWDRTIAVNLSGMFYCIKQVVPEMKAQKSGCIMNIATASARVGLPMRSPYVASKVGVLGLTYTLARELGPHNIRVNSILPGAIDNPRGRALVKRHGEEHGLSFEEAEQEFLGFVSMRTWIEPSEIGDTAVFLASRAGRHISGQNLGVCGNFEWEA
ncbi:MAG: SDR family oxidoreductase [Alphaproteobacteria bacterium]|nr:SDR family oxidoreductase [Alphaproteobacteria bacterium]